MRIMHEKRVKFCQALLCLMKIDWAERSLLNILSKIFAVTHDHILFQYTQIFTIQCIVACHDIEIDVSNITECNKWNDSEYQWKQHGIYIITNWEY